MYLVANIKMYLMLIRGVARAIIDESRRSTIKANVKSIVMNRSIERDMSWAELLEEKAAKHPNRIYLYFEDKTFTYKQINENANRVANFLSDLGAKEKKGVAIIMGNCPEFLDVFIGSQKIGMYSVPVNTSLRGDSLLYILNHSDAAFVVIDSQFLDAYLIIADRLEKPMTVIVNYSDGTDNNSISPGIVPLNKAYQLSAARPSIISKRDNICLILYTSGTTGLPKGVLYRYGNTTVKILSLVAYSMYYPSDILYTCLPLFHGNALWTTCTVAMHRGASVALARKFSASRFWDDIRKYRVTAFNTIGAMIPILMKQPPKLNDDQNRVRFTFSAACPEQLWAQFEKRFGIKIYEAYGAIDGGGRSIVNMGNAPIGSIGKPNPGVAYRLVDDKGNDVPDGTPGELIFESKGKKKSVEYYKNDKATNYKLRHGFIYTGDLVRRDPQGYLYFVGRNAEFMRIKGENVSAYEVEHSILKHPKVLEAAVYAVPSELAEDEIMASVSLVDGHTLDEKELVEFLKQNLPKFAVPRYLRIVKDLPKTETQRIIKKELQKLGIVSGTYDFQKDKRCA